MDWKDSINVPVSAQGEWAAKRYYGDPELASRYLPVAYALLGEVKHRMALGGVSYGHRIAQLPGGTIVRVMRNNEQNILEIRVPEARTNICRGQVLTGADVPIQQTFFGEDLGLGENSTVNRLTVWPNATNAEEMFLSNLSGVGTETFEGFSTGVGAPLTLTFPGAGAATLLGSGSIQFGPNNVGRFPVSGNKYWESTQSFSITFSNPISAFGFYGVDIGDFNGQITVLLTTPSGGTTLHTVPNGIGIPGGSVLFWGVVDTVNPFVRLDFGNTAAGVDFFAFDDMTIGVASQVVVESSAGASCRPDYYFDTSTGKFRWSK